MTDQFVRYVIGEFLEFSAAVVTGRTALGGKAGIEAREWSREVSVGYEGRR